MHEISNLIEQIISTKSLILLDEAIQLANKSETDFKLLLESTQVFDLIWLCFLTVIFIRILDEFVKELNTVDVLVLYNLLESCILVIHRLTSQLARSEWGFGFLIASNAIGIISGTFRV